jgi:pimeloyl-ACP methyl ester carboxylesterase
MPTTERDGVTLAYERAGPGDAGTVVFLEGLGYGRWMWQWQAEPLREAGYGTVLPDNRGTGESDAPEGPYTIEGMVADLEAVLADAGVGSAHVVGASMGGMIAMAYVDAYDRAESLSLLCTSHGGEEAVPTPPETRERMFETPEGADERELIRHRMAPAMTEGFREANPDLIERIVDWRLASDAPPHAREAQAAAVAGFDASDRLGGIDVPTLVVHGTDDRVLPVENGRQLAAAIPDAELVLVEGAPHLVFVEHADEVTARLRRFLDGA